jgi:multiple sugar transport system ATP-binding protein
MPSISLLGVSKTYPGGVVGLRPTDLAVAAGDRLALLGPSGSGKTTLLRLVTGLEEPDAGEIHVGGVRVDRLPPHRRGVALLPQRPALYPHLTVEGNLRAARRAGGHLAYVWPHRGDKPPGSPEIADLLRLGPLLGRYPHELSAGERQRVALGKLLARGAGAWLLDEPFSNLDPVFRSDFRRDLHLLLDRTAATIILVTHDPIDALALGRRVGVLGDGRVQQLGTPDELRDRPGNRFVAFCLGRLSLIDGRVGDGGDPSGRQFVSEDGSVAVPIPPGIARRLGPDPVPNLTLGIRPEDVLARSPGEHPNPLGGGAVLTGWPVVLAEPVGSGWLLTLARGRSRLRVWWPSGSPPPVGATADWSIPADRGLWFDDTGRRIDA